MSGTVKKVTDPIKSAAPSPVQKPVEDTLTFAEAKAKCIASGIDPVLQPTKLTACIADLLNG